jgi:hypothetical protein
MIEYRFTEGLARVKGAVLTLVAHMHWMVERWTIYRLVIIVMVARPLE